jgi:predicted dehydrogenase
MRPINRRTFVKTLAAAATVTVAGTKSSGQVVGANEMIRVAIAGIHGRGSAHVSGFLGAPNVQIATLVDPDTTTYAGRVRTIRDRTQREPQTVQDIRRALEDRNIQAISIATPNHWHALMTIWGAQAGKHVYVEKPCSHNIHEGRIAVDMARRHNVIVQHGTQSRTAAAWNNTIALVRSGRYGKLLVSRALIYKPRGSIGTRPNSMAPATLDFNLWLGPAEQVAFNANFVHYNWHWFWPYGNGDIGNQGVHQLDIARWAIPNATLPRSVVSVGGRFGYSDQADTPNTQISVMDFGESQLICEVRGLQTERYYGQGVTAGNVFHCEEGVIAGTNFYPRGNANNPQPLARLDNPPTPRPGGGTGDGAHFNNFIAAIRSGRREDLNADILEGHYSSALCHLANISYRLGENTPFNGRTQAFGDNREAVETFERMKEHLRERGALVDGATYRVGRRLEIDARTERFTNNNDANRLLTRNYREPFTVPDRVN